MQRTKRNFILSLVALILSLSLVAGVVFAWFSMNAEPTVESFGFAVQSGQIDASLTITRDKYTGEDGSYVEKTEVLTSGQAVSTPDFFDQVKMGETFSFKLDIRYKPSTSAQIPVQLILSEINPGTCTQAVTGGSAVNFNAGSFFQVSAPSDFNSNAVSPISPDTLEGTLGTVGSESPIFDQNLFSTPLNWNTDTLGKNVTLTFTMKFGNWKQFGDMDMTGLNLPKLKLGGLILRCTA